MRRKWKGGGGKKTENYSSNTPPPPSPSLTTTYLKAETGDSLSMTTTVNSRESKGEKKTHKLPGREYVRRPIFFIITSEKKNLGESDVRRFLRRILKIVLKKKLEYAFLAATHLLSAMA